jgi:ABC-2 type transport system ATP-binding protein
MAVMVVADCWSVGDFAGTFRVESSIAPISEYRLMTQLAVHARSLRKTFRVTESAGRFRRTSREVVAVEGIDLDVLAGSFVAVIGPNGAGKSTTIKMLTGVLAPTSGEVKVLGHVPLDERTKLAARIGVVFGQRSQLWWDLPLIESFSLLRHLYRMNTATYQESLDDVTNTFDLGELLPRPVRTLSLGQRMRAELAGALLHRPEMLFLDEPTIGLDVVSKFAMRDALRRIHRDRGTTVILTTHDLNDVDELCERVVIIDHGRIIRDDSLDAMRADIPDGADLEEFVRQIYLRG